MSDQQLTMAQAVERIYQQWKTGWEALHSQVSTDPTFAPYTYENQKFVEPQPLNGVLPPWARVSVRHAEQSEQHTLATIGSRLYRRTANVNVQLFVAVNKSRLQVDGLVDQVRSILEGVSFGPGVVPNGGARVTEVGDSGRWYEVVVTTPVAYYELK